MKVFILVWAYLMLGVNNFVNDRIEPVQNGDFPKVCLIGEHEDVIDNLSLEHETLLLTVCEDDMDIAFEKWMSMLQEMESYAHSIKYDINGIKLWLNVYYNEDGSVRQISFFPKTRSRNVDVEDLSAFFKGFMKRYRLPLTSDVKFAHYGIAHFPTFSNGGLKFEK